MQETETMSTISYISTYLVVCFPFKWRNTGGTSYTKANFSLLPFSTLVNNVASGLVCIAGDEL